MITQNIDSKGSLIPLVHSHSVSSSQFKCRLVDVLNADTYPRN